MHLTVSISLDDHTVVSARGNIDSLDPDYVGYVAYLVAQEVAVDAARVKEEGE